MKMIVRITVILAALLIALAAVAGAEAPANVANPWTEFDSPEALNEAADVNLRLPCVMGVTDVACRLMRSDGLTIAELRFQVNGTPYTLRASGDFEQDISGLYTDGGDTAFAEMAPSGRVFVITDEWKAARWFNISGQYVLTVEDKGAMSAETFEEIEAEMESLTNPYQPVPVAEGVYDDSVSQRAYAEVRAAGDNTYQIEIHWSDSADTDNVWRMTCAVTEDGLLTYHDCVETRVVTAEDGSVTETEANLIPDGYFEIAGGNLYWTGAAEESCRECVFELTAAE